MIFIKIEKKFAVNPAYHSAESLRGNININLYFQPLLNTYMTQAVEILPHGSEGLIFSTPNTMADEDLVTEGSRASAVMVLITFLMEYSHLITRGVKMYCSVFALFCNVSNHG